jgi:DUF1680 family protein
MQSRLFYLLLFFLASGRCLAGEGPKLNVWSPPAGTPENKTFTVGVRLHGQEKWTNLFVYNVKVGHQKGVRKDASMVDFDFTGTVDIRVVYNTGNLVDIDARPNSYEIKPVREGNTFSFSMQQNDTAPRKLVLRINNSWEELCLHIVTNPPEKDAPLPSDPAVYLVHPGDKIPLRLPEGKKTWYFLPGVHQLPQGLWVDLDLGADYPVDKFVLEPGKFRGAVYPQRFLIETKRSLAAEYDIAYDGTRNTDSGSLEKSFSPVMARYVRLLLLGTNANKGLFLSNDIREFRLFANGSNKNLALNHAMAGAMPGFEKAVDGTDKEYASPSGYGNWHAAESFFIDKDGTTLYLAPGAVVKGAICSDGRSHITIKGRGILDGSDLRHTRGEDKKGGVLTGGIWLTGGQDNTVEGITIIDPPLWAVVMNFAVRPVVRNINLFGSVVNTDGIHMSGSQHGLIDGVFLRTPDDNIVMYHYGPTAYITVKNSVFWGDDAHTFLIGLGTRPNTPIHDIRIENCDVLNQQGVYVVDRFTGVMCLWPNGGNEIRNVVFRDIRVDSFRDAWKSALFQFRTDERLTGEGTGTITHVLLQNITYNGRGEQASLLFGAGAGAGIRDVRFENFRINGIQVKDEASAHIRDTGNVSGIRFTATGTGLGTAAGSDRPASSYWHFDGHLGQYIDRIAHARIMDVKNWNRIYPETEAAFRLQQDDRDVAGKGLWRGEFWGKYMLSAIAACRYYHSDELKRRIAVAVDGLLRTQRSDGYIGTYANSGFLTGYNWNVWCRKYTLWGLVEAWELLGDHRILSAAERMADQLMKEVGPDAVDIVQTGMFDGLPSSSILLPFVKLYQADGNPRYLAYAEYIVGRWGAQPNGQPDILHKGLKGTPIHSWFSDTDSYNWAKGYEFMSCVEGLVGLYQVTGKPDYLEAAGKIHAAIAKSERTPVGSVSFDDKFVGAAGLINSVSEICDVVYWNRLSFALFKATGKEKYIAEMERSLYNSLLCAYDPQGDWGLRRLRMAYNHVPAHNHFLMYHQCCVDNLPRALFQFSEAVLSNIRGSVYLSLYCPGNGSVPLPGGDTLRAFTTGDFASPTGTRTTLRLRNAHAFTFFFRMPEWSTDTRIRINGTIQRQASANGWMAIRREWKEGDIIDISFKVGLRWEYFDPAKRDSSYHDLRWYDSVWAAIKFIPATNPQLEARYAQVGALKTDDALPQEPAVTFFYGPIALARDRRISGTDIFRPIADPQGNKERTITPGPAARGIWKTFQVRLGKNQPISFCDFSSAGNTWDKSSEFNTWCLLRSGSSSGQQTGL